MADYRIVRDGKHVRVIRNRDNADLGMHDAEQEAEAHIKKLTWLDEREQEARAYAEAKAGGKV
jgi:hypothetical protein